MAPASLGKLLSSMTRLRRRSTMWSTCSIPTGHSRTQAPQVTQSHTLSSGTAFGTSGWNAVSPSGFARASSSAGPSANSWSRRPMIRSLGERRLPVAYAGHTSWQRPHSVHDIVSSICFQVRSDDRAGPEADSILGHLVVVERERLQATPRACAAEVHVDAGGRDVQVLGVGQVDQEREDDQHVRPDQHALERLGRSSPDRTGSRARSRAATSPPGTRSGRARSGPHATARA